MILKSVKTRAFPHNEQCAYKDYPGLCDVRVTLKSDLSVWYLK